MEKGKTVAFYTLGCKLNAYDTEWLREQFETHGYRVVAFGETADVTVVNTCTVTSQGDAQSRQALRRAQRTSPDGVVVAAGCYAQTDPNALMAMPEVGLVVGTAEKSQLLDLVNGPRPPGKRFVSRSRAAEFHDMDIRDFGGRARAFVKIQEGCNAFCTFCIVPFARGRSRSRSLESTLRQVKRLADAGYEEVILTGIHVGDYGADLDGVGLLDMLEAVEEIEGLRRFRISSIEATEITDAMVDFFSTSRKFCRHLHIPLQSGDDGILKAMRRPYTRSDYVALVERLAERIPDIGLGADVMAGFPGETESAFRNTFELIAQSPVAHLHVFPYSPRHGTPAARMAGQIDSQVKKGRAARLRALGDQKAEGFRRRFLGETLEVIFENRRQPDTGRLQGVSDNYIRVCAPGPDCAMDRVCRVRIDRLEGNQTVGEVVEIGV